MNKSRNLILFLVLCFTMIAVLYIPASAADGGFKNTDISNIDDIANSFIDSVIAKIASNPSIYCDIETKEQLTELHVNCGFKKYVLSDDLFTNDKKLDFSEQDNQVPVWTYILSPNDETVGIKIEFCENDSGGYDLTEVGGKCKAILECYAKAQKIAQKNNMVISDKLIACDTTTRIFVLTDGSKDLLIPFSTNTSQENISLKLTVSDLEEHYKANIKETKNLKKNTNDILYGNGFRFDLLDKPANKAEGKDGKMFNTVIYASICLVLLISGLALFAIFKKRKSGKTI